MLSKLKNLKNITFASVPSGAEAFIVSENIKQAENNIIYIAADGRELETMASMLEYLCPETEVLRFPAWDTVPYDRISPNAAIVSTRISCLSALVQNTPSKNKRIVVTSVGAVLQKLPPQKIFLNSMREIAVGNKLNFNEFLHYVSINGYTRTEQVFEAGEYTVRGDIIDIFPTGTKEPLRIIM